MSAKSQYMNEDGTFKGGFDGCVAYMMSKDGGGHPEDHAKRICGAIAQHKAKEAEDEKLVLQARAEGPVGADGRIMFAPAGEHTIRCGLGKDAVAVVTIRVDASTAPVLNASLAELNASEAPRKALFDKEHEGKEAMAWPVSFEWSESPKPGVYARAEYSSLGKQYVEGRVLRAFSGSFYTDADLPKKKEIKKGQVYQAAEGKRGSEANPARITGLAFPYCGTLTNNPAFHENLPLWARSPREETVEQTAEVNEAAEPERSAAYWAGWNQPYKT